MADFEKFDYESRTIDRQYVENRIISACGTPVWKYLVGRVRKNGASLNGFKIIEFSVPKAGLLEDLFIELTKPEVL